MGIELEPLNAFIVLIKALKFIGPLFKSRKMVSQER